MISSVSSTTYSSAYVAVRSPASGASCGSCGTSNCGCGTSGGLGSNNAVGKTQTGIAQAAADAEKLKQIQQLRSRDQEVRAHEAAHQAVAGSVATSGASFTYQKGPDGVLYAIGGEVKVDTSPVPGDPEATLRKAETIARAALAPADPSGADRAAAAQAAQMAAQARAEIAAQQAKRFEEVGEISAQSQPRVIDAVI